MKNLKTCPYCLRTQRTTKMIVEEHDLVVCLGCGEVSIFNQDLSLRKIAAADVENLQRSSLSLWESIKYYSSGVKFALTIKQRLSNVQ